MKKSRKALSGAMAMCMAVAALGALAGCENLPAPAAEHVHSWGEWEVTTPATCTADGEKTRVCTLDPDHKETEKIDKLGHDYSDEWTVDLDATCEADGSKSRHCNNCDAKADATVIPATDHDWGDWTDLTPATCTAAKTQKRVCNHNAAHTETRTVGEPLGHSWDDGTVTTPPQLGVAGEKTYTCTVDGCGATKTEPVAALEHTHSYTGDWQKDGSGHWKVCDGDDCNEISAQAAHDWDDGVVTKPATCAAAGVKTYTCETCGFVKTEPVDVDPAAHDWGEWTVTTPATCTTDGVKTKVCAHDATHTQTEAIAATGHTLTAHPAVAATCTEPGTQAYWTCGACGKTFSDADGENEIAEPVSVPAPGHDYDTEFTVDKAATCTEPGSESKHCKNCDATTEITEIPATGHNYQYIATKADGSDKYDVVYKCVNCGDVDDSKTAYECDATVQADAGKYTFTPKGTNNSYALANADVNKYFVSTTHTGSLGKIPDYDSFSFVPAVAGEYIFTFEHLTDNMTSIMSSYHTADSDTAMTNSRSAAVIAAYNDVLTIVCAGTTPYNSLVTSLTFTVTDAYVGNKFTFGLRSENATVDSPVTYILTATMAQATPLSYGENTVKVTKSGILLNAYTFTPEKTQNYSITAPAGLSAMADGVDLIIGNDAEQSANFSATAGVPVTIIFSSATVGEYKVTIGEEILTQIMPDTPLNNHSVAAKNVAVVQVGAVETGKYSLQIKVGNSLMQSIIYFGKNINPDYNEIYGPADKYGMGGTAEIIYQNMRITKGEGIDYECVAGRAVFTVTLDLQAGDKLVFAHSNTIDGVVSLTLTKAA